MAKPVVIWILQIMNEYFRDGFCRNIKLNPSEATRRLMLRRNYRLMSLKAGEWQLIYLGDNGNIATDELCFFVELTDDRLYYRINPNLFKPQKAICLNLYAVDSTVLLPGDEIKYKDSVPRIIFELNLSLTGTNDMLPATTVIHLERSEFYWEYIFIYRNQEMAKNKLELVESSGLIEFLEVEDILYYGQQAVKFRSVQKIKSAEKYPYDLFLNEMIRDWKREIMRKLPTPEPGVFMDTPSDVMSNVIYV